MIPFAVGQEHRIVVNLTAKDVERFADVSGDCAPLHTDRDFARRVGFDRPVVHGALLAAYVSRLVGMWLPGPNSVMERIDLSFRQPCYAPCEFHVTGRVRQISEAVSSIVLDITVSDISSRVYASGKTWHRILNQSGLA